MIFGGTSRAPGSVRTTPAVAARSCGAESPPRAAPTTPSANTSANTTRAREIKRITSYFSLPRGGRGRRLGTQSSASRPQPARPAILRQMGRRPKRFAPRLGWGRGKVCVGSTHGERSSQGDGHTHPGAAHALLSVCAQFLQDASHYVLYRGREMLRVRRDVDDDMHAKACTRRRDDMSEGCV